MSSWPERKHVYSCLDVHGKYSVLVPGSEQSSGEPGKGRTSDVSVNRNK